MASAVDSRLAYARLSAVATASRLPTANRGSNNSYTTSWDTTNTVVAFQNPSDFQKDPLTEVLQAGARELLAQAVEAEVSVFLGSHAALVDAAGRRRVVRNGYLPERFIQQSRSPIVALSFLIAWSALDRAAALVIEQAGNLEGTIAAVFRSVSHFSARARPAAAEPPSSITTVRRHGLPRRAVRHP